MSVNTRGPAGQLWATLIGIGSTGSDPPHILKGAVNDAIAMQRFLSLGPTAVNTSLLITQPESSEAPSSIGTALSWKLATYDSVISRLQHIIHHGHRGDKVYIHFSGHGTRSQKEAVALVLFDTGSFGTRYLYSDVLRSAINRMVVNGMLVTLVLDCCFSGSVLRTGRLQRSDIRYAEYNPSVDGHFENHNPFLVDQDNQLREPLFSMPSGRGPGQRLLDPSGYTVLSACCAHELATEIDIGDGVYRGALSYFLLDSLASLRKRGVGVSCRTLHQHLTATFHARYPVQTPMLYGLNSMSFLNEISPLIPIALVSAYSDMDGNLALDAGEAHGVHTGDVHALYPFDTPEVGSELRMVGYTKAEVVTVQHLSSKLRIPDLPGVNQVKPGSVWKAKLITTLPSHQVRIGLAQGVPCVEALLEKASNFPLLSLIAETNSQVDGGSGTSTARSQFQLHARDKSIYEIQDEMARSLVNLPAIELGDSRASDKLLTVLGHLAAYKYSERIENLNPYPHFEASFSLECMDRAPEADGYYTTEHGELLMLRFKNLDSHHRYLAILSFSSSWKVTNNVYAAGEGHCLAIPPISPDGSSTIELPLQMKVPRHLLDQGVQCSESTLKVWITSKPTTFPLLILPQLCADEVRSDDIQMIRNLKDRFCMWGGLAELRGGDEGNWSVQTFLLRTSLTNK